MFIDNEIQNLFLQKQLAHCLEHSTFVKKIIWGKLALFERDCFLNNV